MIENEMANIKDKLGKYLKFIMIAGVVGFLISIVGILFTYSEPIMLWVREVLGVSSRGGVDPTDNTLQTLSSALTSIFRQANYGKVAAEELTEAQINASKAFAQENAPILLQFMQILSLVYLGTNLVVIIGGIILSAGFKKESLRLVKFGEVVILLGIFLVIASVVGYVVFCYLNSYLFSTASIFFLIAGFLAAGIYLFSLVLAIFGKLFDKKVRKVLSLVTGLSNILTIILVAVALVLSLAYSQENIVKVLSTYEFVFAILCVTSAFASLGFTFMDSNLLRLKQNKEDDDLYRDLKAMATEICDEKDSVLIKKNA